MHSTPSFRASVSLAPPGRQCRNNRDMRLSLRFLTRFVGVVGLLSFACLLVAIGTDFWYIIHVSEQRHNSSVSLSSHTGLWRTCNFQSQCSSLVNPFKNGGNFTYSERQILNLHGAFLVLLPLSVIIMVVSSVLGIIKLLARARRLLVVTGIQLIFGALVTMCGVCIYVAYWAAAYREATRLDLALNGDGTKTLDDGVDIRFGWSLALACVSSLSEALTGVTILVIAWRMRHQEPREDQGFEIQ
ncbi:transmembrane protein 114 [Clupea harengus]|uniref:Transmembrane protein 114 n=1 Tax=Clupea harengus TaxID=7950 RepID=A0A6P8FTX2_CLUHA|nr:transmembrane protein 114 [Clupea harengus]